MKKTLETSEWILSLSLVLILASLLMISRFHEHRKRNQLLLYAGAIERPVNIAISGEVLRPGVYSALPGTRLGDLVKKSRPKRFADLSAVDLDCQVETALAINVPPLSELEIYIEGAVAEPVELKLPLGSRICDLRSKIQCDPDAELRFFKGRRLLKDGERIVVPRAS